MKCSGVFIEVAKSDRRALGHDEVTLETVLHLRRRTGMKKIRWISKIGNSFAYGGDRGSILK